MTTEDDIRFMAATIRLARRHEGWTAANPSVGCLIVAPDGTIIASAITASGGRPHAEPLAVAAAGRRANGTTAYVSLEPCAHHGRTPPCARSLIDAGTARVVTAVVDPDERVNERGHAMLRQAGIAVEAGICEAEARRDLAAYLMHKRQGRPFVTLKLAVSADGFLGIAGRGQVPITGAVARAQTHMMRARHHAILVGIGTILADDPQLTCRLPGLEHRSPLRIVLDPAARLAGGERVVASAAATPTLVVRSDASVRGPGNCEVMACETENGRVALPELLDDLGARGIMSVMVEGGAAIAGSFIADGLVDRLALFAGARPVAGDGAGEPIRSPVAADSPPAGFECVENLELGEDRLYVYERAGA